VKKRKLSSWELERQRKEILRRKRLKDARDALTVLMTVWGDNNEVARLPKKLP
jgi:hypothetical protein